MQVIAFATAAESGWRWRIVGYSGEMLEESSRSFPTIASAVADGSERMHEIDTVAPPPPPYRTTRRNR